MFIRNYIKLILLAGFSTGYTVQAFSQSNQQDLETRIEKLEQVIQQLKQELHDQKHKQTHSKQKKSEKRQSPTLKKTKLSIGGFIDTDIHLTRLGKGKIPSNSVARDFYIPGATPVSGESDPSPVLDFTAQSSRFFIKSATPFGKQNSLKTHLQIDFLLSPGGNEVVSNSFNPRIRHAYIRTNHWLVGQTWSNFMNTSALPESASFLTLGDGIIFIRQPQIRYTNGAWTISVENPDTTVNLNTGKQESDTSYLPDLVVRYLHNANWGNISLSTVLRDLNYTYNHKDHQKLGWGLSLAGRVKPYDQGDIRFSFSGGKGIGRYIGLNAVGGAYFLPIENKFESNTAYGGYLAYRHIIGKTRLNIGYSYIQYDNSLTSEFPLMNKTIQSAYTALMWDVLPKLTLGFELLYGKRTLQSDLNGDILRFTFSTRYTF